MLERLEQSGIVQQLINLSEQLALSSAVGSAKGE